MPVLLNGERLVVWRSQTGRAGVWNDRCPHRGMRLSLGATRGETLICPYHGWEFASDGSCSRIPAHPDLSPSRAARARLYPVLESDGYVWACIGEPATAHPAYRLMQGLRLHPVRTMHFRIDAETLALALLLHPLGAGAQTLSPVQSSYTGIVTVTDASMGLTVSLEFPGLVVAAHEGHAAYAALIQPTGDDTAAVHLSVADPRKNGIDQRRTLNRDLVRFRQILPVLAAEPGVHGIRKMIAGMADLQQQPAAGP